MQIQIYGDVDIEPNREGAMLLCLECCKLDLPLLISEKLALLDFESRKDAAQVWTAHIVYKYSKLYCSNNQWLIQTNNNYINIREEKSKTPISSSPTFCLLSM